MTCTFHLPFCLSPGLLVTYVCHLTSHYAALYYLVSDTLCALPSFLILYLTYPLLYLWF
ncbi:hypothetical protein EDB87DRAFT_1661563, partial [Lactarius vividus]